MIYFSGLELNFFTKFRPDIGQNLMITKVVDQPVKDECAHNELTCLYRGTYQEYGFCGNKSISNSNDSLMVYKYIET